MIEYLFDKSVCICCSGTKVCSPNGQRVQPVGADGLTESDVQVTQQYPNSFTFFAVLFELSQKPFIPSFHEHMNK